MNEFFTWSMLATMAGGTAAVTLITQFIKWISGNKVSGWGIRAISFVVAMIIMFVAPIVGGTFAVADIILYILNAVIITLAANGLYDNVTSVTGTKG